MPFRVLVLVLTLIVIVASALATYLVNKKSLGDEFNSQNYKRGMVKEVDRAIDQAKIVYEQKRRLGVDFSEGPCLSNDLLPNWVADIAHNPRVEEDNHLENQCQAYLEGRAEHFVELDPQGELIRAK